MGANYTIAVDVSSQLMSADSLNTLASILNQSVNFRIIDNSTIQKELADYNIRVEDLDSYSVPDFTHSREILEIGREQENYISTSFGSWPPCKMVHLQSVNV